MADNDVIVPPPNSPIYAPLEEPSSTWDWGAFMIGAVAGMGVMLFWERFFVEEPKKRSRR